MESNEKKMLYLGRGDGKIAVWQQQREKKIEEATRIQDNDGAARKLFAYI